ncbi:MAG TPA: PAS domain S-box protein, partial [Gemmatimonadaceae bacterium]|nr:PAS domain S-box protein [Gemmatimonadaceae bacterium]
MLVAHDVTDQALASRAFDAMPGSMGILDPDTQCFTAFNEAAHADLGYSREEFARLRVTDFDASADAGEVDALTERNARTDERRQFRRQHRRKDGEVRDVLVTSRRIGSGERAPTYVTWVDITEQVRLEAASRAQGALLDTVLANIPLMVVLFNADGRASWVNRTWEQVLGWTVPEMLATHGLRGCLPDPALRDAAAAFLSLGSREWHRLVPRSRAGIDVTSSWASVRLADGRLIVIGRDDRPMLAAEAERASIEQALRESEALNRAVLDALPVAVWVSDAAGKVTTTNARVAEIFGFAKHTGAIEEYGEYRAWWPDTGTPLGPEDWAMARALLHGEVCRGERVEIERFDDGRRRIVLNHAAPIRGRDGILVGAVAAASDITEQVLADSERESALRASERRYELAARATNAAIWDWGIVDDTHEWSEGAQRIFGLTTLGTIDTWKDRLHPDDRERVLAGVDAVVGDAAGGHEWSDAYRFRRADGTYAAVRDRGYVVRDAEGRATRMIGAMEDVTMQLQLEEQVRHSQRMDAVGQLAGGIAHDFNNLLTVIAANALLARDAIPPGSTAHADLTEIDLAADRAAALVRQLLTFSRRQPTRSQPLRVADVVTGAEKMLRRVIGEEITLEVDVSAAGTATVLADRGQLEQVLMNLAVNARDAMLTPRHGHAGRGGTLRFEVSEVHLSPHQAAEWDGIPPLVAAGHWVRLVVR